MKKAILETLKTDIPDIKGVYLFGSQAQNLAWRESDIDIAILPASKVPPKQLWNAKEHLARKLNQEVDLVDLLQASIILQYQIIHEGERIAAYDEHACNMYETYIDAKYIAFNELRQPLVKDIMDRGRI